MVTRLGRVDADESSGDGNVCVESLMRQMPYRWSGCDDDCDGSERVRPKLEGGIRLRETRISLSLYTHQLCSLLCSFNSPQSRKRYLPTIIQKSAYILDWVGQP